MEASEVKYKYSVVTYIFGDYELVHEIECEIENDVEYILVTDNPNLKSDTWTVIVDKDLDGKTLFDKVFSVRYNLFKYCHSDICFRIDGSIGIMKSLTPIVEDFIESGCDVGLSCHIYRDNIVEEYQAWYAARNYPMENIKRHITFYDTIGFDYNRKGLIQMNFAINKKSKITDDIDRMMYAIMHYLGEGEIDRLDQTVFSVVMDRFFPNVDCYLMSEYLLHSDYLAWYFHGKNERIPLFDNLIITPYFRNTLAEIRPLA